VVIARGKVVADGATTEIRALVSGRTVTATLPGVPADDLRALAGVVNAERHGDAILLRCNDSDATLRALLSKHKQVRDIEVKGAGLEEAFLALTDADDDSPVQVPA
jgi:ABC-2 type transport system ATP-binding protein